MRLKLSFGRLLPNDTLALEFRIGFCQWAQIWFTADMPKLTTLNVSFHDAEVADYPEQVDMN